MDLKQEHALKSLKNLLSSDVVMGYYNYNKEIKVVVDDSPLAWRQYLPKKTRLWPTQVVR